MNKTVIENKNELNVDMKNYLNEFYTAVDTFRMNNDDIFRKLHSVKNDIHPKKAEVKQLLSNMMITSDQLDLLLDAIDACQNN